MMRFKLLTGIYLCLSLACQAKAVDTLQLTNTFVAVDLLPYSSLYVDPTGQLSVEDVVQHSRDFVTDFVSEQRGSYPEVYWQKVHLFAENSIHEARVLLPFEGRLVGTEEQLDNLDVYLLDEDGTITHCGSSGYQVPWSEKALPVHNMLAVVPVSFAAQKQYTLYIRLQNTHTPQITRLDLELRSATSALPQVDFSLRWLILIPTGMFLVIGLYVLVFFYFVRDKAFLYFGLACLLYALDVLVSEPDGGFAGLLPEHPFWWSPLFHFSLFSVSLLMLFGWEFINIKKHFPVWSTYYRIILILLVVVTAGYFIRTFWYPRIIYQTIFMLLLFAYIPFCIRFLFSKVWEAQLFALGFLSFIAGNIIGVFVIMSGGNFGEVLWAIGQFILLFTFAVGLGYRLLESERERSRALRIKELDRMKNRFFTNISHEFRTPLALILGPLQKSEEQVPASELEEPENQIPVKAGHLQVMKRNALRLKALIDQILDLSKIESGKMQLQLTEGSIIEFLKNRIAEFKDIAGNKGIALVALYPAEVPNACFDPDKVEKILGNVLSNAVKFTPENGEIYVEVSIRQPYIEVKVTDNGPGMSKTELHHLFDRFYQADEARMQGSGVGMALVKELVDLHRGHISVESQEGKGSSITWSIAIDRSAFPGIDIVENWSAKGESGLEWGATMEAKSTLLPSSELTDKEHLVLIVEDNVDLRSYLASILASNFRILTASDGMEGKQQAIAQLPDLIISDVMMPELSGTEMCRILKQEEKTSHIPVILLTAKADRTDKLLGLQTGADDYLTKPFDAKELELKINNLLQTRKRWQEKYGNQLWISQEIEASSMEEQFLQSIARQIQENLSNEYFSVEDLGRAIGYSRSQLFRKLKALTNKSPIEWIKEYRLNHAKALLEKGAATVSEVAYEVGYSNLSYFSRSFKKRFGVLPSEVR